MKQKIIFIFLGLLLLISVLGTGYVASLGIFTAYPYQNLDGYEFLAYSVYCVAFSLFVAHHFGNASKEVFCKAK